MIVFETLRKINKLVKHNKKMKAGIYLSPVRRIERVYPLKDMRVCAMTFDDGPSALPPKPSNIKDTGLTEVLISILNSHEATGTFDCVGGTHENYPDKRGKINTAKWGGISHDHYPDFKNDHLGGIINQTELGRAILENGHEMANHGGRHVIFGPMRLIYDSRECLSDLDAVIEDLTLFHNYAYEKYGHTSVLSRPPHYIDGIRGGYSAYDAYAMMGYQYMAASFDGGGWKPSRGSYSQDVEDMVRPLSSLLALDANALNGQIIFQKDGCNMSIETPVADALSKQLECLSSYEYKVIGVQKLVEMSPFEDFGEGHKNFEYARDLVNLGYIVAYKNNTFQKNRELTFGELVTMTTPKDLYVALTSLKSNHLRLDFDYEKWDVKRIEDARTKVDSKHPYYLNFKYAESNGYLDGILYDENIDKPLDASLAMSYLSQVAKNNGKVLADYELKENTSIKRYEILPLLYSSLI